MHDSLAANLDLIFNMYAGLIALAFALVFIGGPIVLYRRMVRRKGHGPSRPESSEE